MNRSLVNKIVTVLLLDEALEDEDDSHSTRGKTRKWMKRRHRQGFHNNLVKELLAEDTRTYEEMMRMPRATFLAIWSAIEADITPKNKVGGAEPVSAEERLTIAIRFFATGETFVSMEKQFRVSQRAISYITLEVSSAISRHLGPTYLKAPNSPEEWISYEKYGLISFFIFYDITAVKKTSFLSPIQYFISISLGVGLFSSVGESVYFSKRKKGVYLPPPPPPKKKNMASSAFDHPTTPKASYQCMTAPPPPPPRKKSDH